MDFLDALHQGVWEVTVPKADVTEPLVPPWKRSEINVPSPETIASYRNGQYHAHETKDDYRVHLDRYDPTKNPIMHLVDDAPLALMLFETLETLAVSAKDARHKDPVARMADLRLSGGMRMVLGLLIVVTGLVLLLLAFGSTRFLFEVIIPALVALTGIFLVAQSIVLRARGEHAKKDAVHGVAFIVGGIFLYFFWEVYVTLLLFILAVWFITSSVVTLFRVIRTRGKLPQGFAFTAGLGVASLVLGYLAFVDPVGLVRFLVFVLGIVMLLAGGFLVVDGYGLRNAAKLIENMDAGA